MAGKENIICDALDCLIFTCSKHRCQFKKSRRRSTWIKREEGCKMYKSRNQWKTFYTPPRDVDDDLLNNTGDIDLDEQQKTREET